MRDEQLTQLIFTVAALIALININKNKARAQSMNHTDIFTMYLYVYAYVIGENIIPSLSLIIDIRRNTNIINMCYPKYFHFITSILF